MNILIIDDDPAKRALLTALLMKDNPENKVRWFDNLQGALLFINDNMDYIDLILLDWCFPPNDHSRPLYSMGRQVLHHMKFNGLNNKTIICSSDLVNVDTDEFPFVLGAIVYCPGIPIIDQINNLLNPQERIEDQVHSLKRKKQQPNTGYRRRMSSEPWWKK